MSNRIESPPPADLPDLAISAWEVAAIGGAAHDLAAAGSLLEAVYAAIPLPVGPPLNRLVVVRRAIDHTAGELDGIADDIEFRHEHAAEIEAERARQQGLAGAGVPA